MNRSLKLACVTMFGMMLVAPAAHAQIPPPATASNSVASGNTSEPEANSAQKREEAEGGTEAFRKSPSVIKLGGMLGMKPATASSAFEWLNFAILAGAILYALGKALPKYFNGRTATIQKNIVEARVATEEANLRLAGVEARLSKLDGEIAAIKAESEREAAAEAERVKTQMEQEKQRILQAAEQEISAASAQAGRNLRAYAAEIAVDRAAQRLEISADDDRALIQSFAARLTAAGGKN